MIKANKGSVQLSGSPAMLDAELTSVVIALHNNLKEIFGDEFAAERIEAIFNRAMKSEKEEDAVAVKLDGDKAEKFAEAFLKTLAAAVERKGEE